VNSAPEVSEQLDIVAGVPMRSLRCGNSAGGPHVVVIPGLGALGYLVPYARAVGATGAVCTLLDLPGFGTPGGLASRPTIRGIAEAAAAWVRACTSTGDIVLLGHSTGAQAALHGGLLLQEDRPPTLVVLAGPTVAPRQRSLLRLACAAPAAYRFDSPGELVVLPDLLRTRADLILMLRSAIADRPEDHVRSLRSPLLVTAGSRDAFAPTSWLSAIATAAPPSCGARVVQLAGSHNNPYTHPSLLAKVVVAASSPVTCQVTVKVRIMR